MEGKCSLTPPECHPSINVPGEHGIKSDGCSCGDVKSSPGKGISNADEPEGKWVDKFVVEVVSTTPGSMSVEEDQTESLVEDTDSSTITVDSAPEPPVQRYVTTDDLRHGDDDNNLLVVAIKAGVKFPRPPEWGTDGPWWKRVYDQVREEEERRNH